jgi:putative two-component system response regulator
MLKEQGYRPRQARSGAAALMAAANKPPDLILLDIMMPEMDGYEVCRRLKSDPALKDVPVIFLSALIETEDKIRAFSAGAADYVSKPFQFDEIRARVETHLGIRHLQLQTERHNKELEALVAEQVKEIADSQMATIFALAKLAESRDDETGRHLEHVQELCRLLALRMRGQGLHDVLDDTFIANVVHAAPLHDIGKVAIPDRILLKPGALTAEEFEIMKTHTILGAQTLEAVRREYSHNAFIAGVQIARCITSGGTAVTRRIGGGEIPHVRGLWRWWTSTLQIAALYKQAKSHEEVCGIILAGGGTQFCPDAVAAFTDLQRDFEGVWRAMDE